MPVKKITIDDIPSSRFQNSPLKELKEWKSAVRVVNQDSLKPGEAYEVEIPDETIAALPLKDPIQAFVVALRRYIRERRAQIDVITRAGFESDKLNIYLVGRSDRVA